MGFKEIITNLSNMHQVKEKAVAMCGKSFKPHENNHVIRRKSYLTTDLDGANKGFSPPSLNTSSYIIRFEYKDYSPSTSASLVFIVVSQKSGTPLSELKGQFR